ncbi:hypothetical protein F5X97DRAFT_220025 [Nemania serpens]|nr:hypothetical protein F5X97DRAFT_220025 [Nemania serpens]
MNANLRRAALWFLSGLRTEAAHHESQHSVLFTVLFTTCMCVPYVPRTKYLMYVYMYHKFENNGQETIGQPA